MQLATQNQKRGELASGGKRARHGTAQSRPDGASLWNAIEANSAPNTARQPNGACHTMVVGMGAHGANQSELIVPLGKPWEQFAVADTCDPRLNGSERPADGFRCQWFGIKRVQLAGPAP